MSWKTHFLKNLLPLVHSSNFFAFITYKKKIYLESFWGFTLGSLCRRIFGRPLRVRPWKTTGLGSSMVFLQQFSRPLSLRLHGSAVAFPVSAPVSWAKNQQPGAAVIQPSFETQTDSCACLDTNILRSLDKYHGLRGGKGWMDLGGDWCLSPAVTRWRSTTPWTGRQASLSFIVNVSSSHCLPAVRERVSDLT